MLERVHIENFKCLRDVTVDLGDFTVLIGANDSGKSSFLEVLRSFGPMIEKGYSVLFADDRSLSNMVWHKRKDGNVAFEVSGHADSHAFLYRVDLPADSGPALERIDWDGSKRVWTEKPPDGHRLSRGVPRGSVALAVVTEKGLEWLPIQHGTLYLKTFVEQQPALKRVLTSSIEYQFDVDKLYLPSVPQRDAVLERTGANLAGVLDAMKNWPDPTTFESLQMSLNEAIPTLKRIVLPSATKHSAGAKAIEFVLAGLDQPPVTIPARLASTGALLLTAFLTLSYTDTPDLLLFEEPENGLHPSRLKMVVDILRKMSHGEPGGRKRQIVVTTHSPLLLNFVHPNEVRVFIRDPDTGTRVFPMTDVPDIDRLLKEFAVGELWYLLGEEKLFEGQTA